MAPLSFPPPSSPAGESKALTPSTVQCVTCQWAPGCLLALPRVVLTKSMDATALGTVVLLNVGASGLDLC